MTGRPVTDHHVIMAATMQLVLASSSVQRKALLERLQLPFACHPPDVDERIRHGETPEALVERLAFAKARKVAQSYPDALVIGSDEVASVNGRILNKPEDHADAVRQLALASGKAVDFLTGVCLLNSRSGHRQSDLVTVRVHFRQLTDTEINRYLARDKPYECAGSFRAEAAGITLVESINGSDNTALLGLPLISLQKMLRNEGYIIP